ncbi:endonuclease/exonuclease/phosphatase family protein [Vibrio genomosp. F10]|uniref:Hydrolase n=1 Tax=Vibrio genomosp. F10 TaxID=723171 RepID=A0A1B9QZK7_9VIBR|nr:endonuclease/exonuclease/phosphatase family protein [Vibrio genomosp. F10]OCH76577.1 hydrolase [Vibrio genomosp. F10]
MTIAHLARIFVTALLFLPLSLQAESQLRVASWNIEWLTSDANRSMPNSHRSPEDFNQLQRYFDNMDLDVLSFQEVNDVAAIQRVVGPDYTLWMSDRTLASNKNHQFGDINQYTGFAIHSSLSVTAMPSIQLETHSRSKLRFATYVVINPEGEMPIHLLSVHLKAGCIEHYKEKKDCRRLKEQTKKLRAWIQDRELDNDAYVILGDFNHNLSAPNDWLWTELAHQTGAVLASKNTTPDCKVRSKREAGLTYQYRSVIDHIVLTKRLAFSAPKQTTYRAQDVLNYNLSDHCPIVMAIH